MQNRPNVTIKKQQHKTKPITEINEKETENKAKQNNTQTHIERQMKNNVNEIGLNPFKDAAALARTYPNTHTRAFADS